MTRRKALTIAISVAGLSGLIFVVLLMSKPGPAISHASYAWQPGCHCGKPTTTTAKAPVPAKATTTTAKKATTTATSATKAASAPTGATSTATSTNTSAKTSTKRSTSASAGKSATSTTTPTKRSTTTAGAQDDGAQNDDQNGAPALGATVSSFPGGGDGGSFGSTGDPGGGSSGPSGVAGVESAAAQSVGLSHYYISPVAIGFLLVYGISFALYRTKRLRVATHRKVWNVLLLATFLLCGLMGLVLAVGVTRNPPMELPTWLLVWHVEAGMAMCFISCFHIGWHLSYYLALVTGRRRAPRAEQVPAVERGAARERARRPRAVRPVLVRTEEQRMLAFKQRQAARAGEARSARPASAPSEADRWVEEAKRGVVPAL